MTVDPRAAKLELRRSCTIRIKNTCGATIKLVDWKIDWGRLEPEGPPPETIPAGDTALIFAIATPGPWLTGTEGWIIYEVQDDDGDGEHKAVRFKIDWDVPFMGHNDYEITSPGTVEGRESYEDKADHGWVTFIPPPAGTTSSAMPPDPNNNRNVNATCGQKTGVGDPPPGSKDVVICQDERRRARVQYVQGSDAPRGVQDCLHASTADDLELRGPVPRCQAPRPEADCPALRTFRAGLRTDRRSG